MLYISGGVGLLARLECWRSVTVAASVASLALFALYFNPWLSLAQVGA